MFISQSRCDYFFIAYSLITYKNHKEYLKISKKSFLYHNIFRYQNEYIISYKYKMDILNVKD